jgi:hypothetical protein
VNAAKKCDLCGFQIFSIPEAFFLTQRNYPIAIEAILALSGLDAKSRLGQLLDQMEQGEVVVITVMGSRSCA